MNFSEEIAEMLLRKKAVRVNLQEPFTWTSGLRSPIYCDNRLLISHVDARKVILDGFVAKIEELNLKFDYLAGTATAGIPWAAFLADKLELPMVYVRSAPKAHGAGKQVEGDVAFLQGKKALVVEDLISTGGSSINTAMALRKEVLSEVFVLSIFSYGFEIADKKFRESAVDYACLSDLTTLLKASELPEIEKILPFVKDPENWFAETFNNL